MEELTIEELADKVLLRPVNGIVFNGVTTDFAGQKINEIKKSLESIGIKGVNFNDYLEVYLVSNKNLCDLIIINTDTKQLDEEKRYMALFRITKIFQEEKLISIRTHLKSIS